MRLLASVLLPAILVLPSGGVAHGTERAARIVGADDEGLTLEIAIPALLPGGPDGPAYLPPPGFGLDLRGTPLERGDDLPFLRERVALPPTGEVRLEILALEATAGAAASTVEHLNLGEPGYARFQRFAPLEIRPAVPLEEGGWSILKRARVRIAFDAGHEPAGRVEATPYHASVLGPASEARPMGPAPPPRALGENRVRLDVSREGIHVVTPDWLRSEGVTIDPGLQAADLKLTLDGEEIAIEVADGNGGAWGDGNPGEEWVAFYGRPRLGEDEPGVWESGDFSDVNVYWLSAEAGPRLRVQPAGGPPPAPQPLASFPWTGHIEADEFFLGASLGTGETHWYYTNINKGVNTPDNPNPRLVTAPLPGLAPGGDGLLEYELLGRNWVDACISQGDPEHVAVVCAGGADGDCVAGGPSVADEAVWGGFTLQQGSVVLEAARLTDPLELRVHVPATDPRRCLVDTNEVFDVVAPNWFRVTWPRLPVVTGNMLVLTPDPGEWSVEVTGFRDGHGMTAVAWDVTDPAAPLTLSPAGVQADRMTLEHAAATEARWVVAGGDGLLLPDAAREEAGPDLSTDPWAAGFEGHYLVIAEGGIAADPDGSQALTDLMAARTADPAWTGAVISVDAVLDRFAEGIHDARGIQAFLSFTFGNWADPPDAVLLVGDGSVDMKDNKGMGGALVPTFLHDNPAFSQTGWFASDLEMAQVRGTDDIPDLWIGRLPVRSGPELRAAVGKILAYENDAPAADPLGWRSHLVMSADNPDPNASGEEVFETSHDTIAAELPPMPYQSRKLYWREYEEDVPERTPDDYRADLLAELNPPEGALIWSYAGHGNHAFLSRALTGIFASLTLQVGETHPYQPGDLDLLANASALPFLVHANCLTGQFMVAGEIDVDPAPGHQAGPLESMAELMVEKADGGAVAALSPGGLTIVNQTGIIIEKAYRSLLVNEPATNISRALHAGGVWFEVAQEMDRRGADVGLLQQILLGDPLTPIAVPGPSKVQILPPVAGNGIVTLDWVPNDPGENVVAYVLEENHDFGDWTEIPSSPALAPTHDDTDVSNGICYDYRIYAVDGNGFSGPASDTVTACPLNPDPPAMVQNVQAVCGDGQVDVSWDRNAETDLTGYFVHWGHAPDDPGTPGPDYPHEKSVFSFFTSTTLEPVDTSRAVFLCVRTKNTSGLWSECSPELRVCGPAATATASPWLPDLRVRRQDLDVVLEWRHVVHDVWGRPKADVARYEVFRDIDPAAISVEASVPVQTVDCNPSCPDDISWTDSGAVGDGSDLVFYAAPALDATDETSGVSHDLPRTVENLQVGPTGPTRDLTWDPVTRDLRGGAARIERYDIYGSDTPADVERVNLRGSPHYLASVPGAQTSATVDGYAHYAVVAVDEKGAWSP